MTLANLMMVLSLVTPFFASVMIGIDKGLGVGLLIGLVVGLVVSVVSFRGFRIVQAWGFGLMKEEETPLVFALSWLLLVALFIWIVGFSFLGARLTEFVIHVVAVKV